MSINIKTERKTDINVLPEKLHIATYEEVLTPCPQRELKPTLTTFLDPTTNLQEIQRMEKHVKLYYGNIITKIQTMKNSVRQTTLVLQQTNRKKTRHKEIYSKRLQSYY